MKRFLCGYKGWGVEFKMWVDSRVRRFSLQAVNHFKCQYCHKRSRQTGWLLGRVFPVTVGIFKHCDSELHRSFSCSLNIWHDVIPSLIFTQGPSIGNHSFYVLKMILSACSRVQVEFSLHIDTIGKSRRLTNATRKFVPNELPKRIWG